MPVGLRSADEEDCSRQGGISRLGVFVNAPYLSWLTSGTERLRQILRAKRFGISLWRSTASVGPVWGLHYNECSRGWRRHWFLCRRP